MANGGIVDISTGVAQTIGRYFSVVSVVPSSFYVVFVYLLIKSGSWQHPPDWNYAFTSLGHLGLEGVGFLALLSIGLGVIIHPIQFAVVQFFEGYWGPGPISRKLRSQRILHYQRKCWDLEQSGNYAGDKVVDWSHGSQEVTSAAQVQFRSQRDEARRIRDTYFPPDFTQIMPTRLGNVMRRAEFQAGSQYGMSSLQVVSHLLLIAPTSHVDYVNDQRSQLDLAVRMTTISLMASATALLFLWPYHLWVLVVAAPYALAYFSYRGSVVAARHYGSAFDTLINLDRFALYQQLHLPPPISTADERETNTRMADLLDHDPGAIVRYKHPEVL